VIYKQRNNGFKIFDPNYQYNVTFPNEKIDFFKYCPKNYILGVTINEEIKIYSRDYNFKELDHIDKFITDEIGIVSLACENDKIIVSATDNQIYIFQLSYDEGKTS
jgi:hypothetical protein